LGLPVHQGWIDRVLDNNILKILQCLLVAVSLLLPSCSMPDDPSERKVITVGETIVTLGELERDLKLIASGMDIPPDAMVERILDHYLILEYGREKGIAVSDRELEQLVGEIKGDYDEKDFRDLLLKQYMDFERWKEALRRQLLVKKILKGVSAEIPPVSHEEMKSYYEKHKEEFKHPVMVKLRQIVTGERKEAEGARERIFEGEDMGDLAREISIAPEARNGGVIGWVEEDTLEETMSKAFSSLKAGQISPVVKTSYGYHIFQVLERREAGYKALHEVAKEVESRLFYQKEREFFGQWLKGLRQKFSVWVDRELIMKTLESA